MKNEPDRRISAPFPKAIAAELIYYLFALLAVNVCDDFVLV